MPSLRHTQRNSIPRDAWADRYKGNEKKRVWYNGGFKTKPFTKIFEENYCDNIPNTMYLPEPTLIERLKECKCELCGAENVTLVMHHVRNLNQLKADTRWNTLMLKRHRKTLAVCQCCDEMIHQSYDR